VALKEAAPPARPRPNIMIYGPPKTGKTLAAASAAQGVRPKGMVYLNADLPDATWGVRQMYGDRIFEPEWPKDGVMQTMLDVQALAVSDDRPDIVVVDPISELYRRLLEEKAN
jgi:hypothetical protein